MATVEQGLIIPALQKIGALASGETPSTSERDDAFARLNDIIDSWNAEPDAIVKQTVTDYIVNGQASIVVSPAPLLITGATAIFAGTVTQPVEVCTPTRWSEIALDRAGTATFARGILCDYARPSSTVHIGPRFVGVLQLVMLLQAFTPFSSVSDNINLPSGYTRALMYALAVELQSEYGANVPGLAELAAGAKASLGTLNAATRTSPPPPVA